MSIEPTPLAGLFSPHLKELRKRLILSALSIIVGSLLAYVYAEPLADLLMVPLRQARPDLTQLIYTHLTEAFIAYIKLAILAGIIASFPVWFSQLWLFVTPGLKKKERRTFGWVLFWATSLFTGGVVFCYFGIMPTALKYLLGLAGDDVQPLPRLGAYLTFSARACLAFGLAFEIPFLMMVAGKIGLVNKNYFNARRKYFYLAIVVLTFLLAAGDPFATVLLALPLFILYEAGIIIMKFFSKDENEAPNSDD